MSMLSSLDALEAATDATSAPRAAVFKPKVKPRARKVGGGGDTRSATAKPPPAPDPQERASTGAAELFSILTTAGDVDKTAAETSSGVPELQKPPPTTAQFVVDIRGGTGEQPFASEDGAIPPTDDTAVLSVQYNAPKGHIAAPEVPIVQLDDVSSDEIPRVQDGRPPVAIRSNFPLPPAPATRGVLIGKDLGVAARSSPEQDPGVRPASKPQDIEESDLPKVQNPDSASSPTGSKGGVVRSRRRVAKDPKPPFKDANEERRRIVVDDDEEEEEEEEEVEVEDDEAEPVSEVLPTGKRGRKRAFSHSTSQPRMNRKEREEVAPKIDFSKTDLSNPGKLTMREIIRRAEAIERKKLKVDAATKKSAQNDGTRKQATVVEASGRDAVSMAPQVQVINGRIVINEQSLTIGAYETSRQNTESYTRVEENASRLNYNSYSNRTPTERWKSEDTDVFYMALQQFGTDFELIQNLFPGRTRRQVKAKFKKEERNNPRRLQDALAHRPKDQVHYTDMISRLKADEPDPSAGDPFASILAYTNDAAADEQTDIAATDEQTDIVAADEQTDII